MTIIGIAIWIGGVFYGRNGVHPIFLPKWLLLLCGIREHTQIGVHRFAVQIFGVAWIAWASVTTLITSSGGGQSKLFITGIIVLIALDGLFVVIVYLVHRISQ
jgi:hypothetical protein